MLLAEVACDRGDDRSARNEIAATKPDRPPAVAPIGTLPPDLAAAHPTLSPNARVDVHLQALAEAARAVDPADLAGRLWLEAADPVDRGPGAPSSRRPSAVASSHWRFTLVFEVGPPGIAEGGSLFFLADPFWHWSTAQSEDAKAPGFLSARLRTSDADASPASPAAARLVPGAAPGAFRIEGRALVAGEQIELVYGAGPAGARVDRYAERGAPLRIGLDANADGVRAWLPEPVRVDVVAAAPETLVAFGPAQVAPGQSFELSLALVDRMGNRAPWPSPSTTRPDGGPTESAPATAAAAGLEDASREIRVESSLAARLAPARGLGAHPIRASGSAPLRIAQVAPLEEGPLRLRVRMLEAGEQRFEADLPPIMVREGATRLLWADLHGHSAWSDGSGTPDDYYRYAREVARLDAVALTDHDHWGLDALDERPDRLAELLDLANRLDEPGRFVTLPGYEWTSWLHGHRHVLSFDETLPFFSSLDPASDRPDELWAGLRGRRVLTFAHHSAGEPVATNWHFAPDPELEPVTEIASVHGMSEASDAPAPIGGAVEGHFVRDVLRHGARLGFIGSGDSHDGHPGLAELAGGQGGLAGLFVESFDRIGVQRALAARRTFATNGIRPWLEVSLDGVEMGGETRSAPPSARGAGNGLEAEALLRIRYEATAPVVRVDLVRSGHVASIDAGTLASEGSLSLTLERRIPPLSAGEFHYVRILQRDGGVAWSSPIFARAAPGPTADAARGERDARSTERNDRDGSARQASSSKAGASE